MKQFDAATGCVTIAEASEIWSPLQEYIRDGKLDLGNPKALQEYNKAILFKLTGYKLFLPDDVLIPTICLRKRYLDVIEDMLEVNTLLDVGTGASAIIALLAAARGWKVYATEIDQESCRYAEKNIVSNKADVTLFRSTGGIIEGVIPNRITEEVDVAVCYPPFYPDDRPGRTSKKKRGFKGKDLELFGGTTGIEFTYRYVEECAKMGIKTVSVLLHKESFVEKTQTKMKGMNYDQVEKILITAGNRKRYVVIGRN